MHSNIKNWVYSYRAVILQTRTRIFVNRIKNKQEKHFLLCLLHPWFQQQSWYIAMYWSHYLGFVQTENLLVLIWGKGERERENTACINQIKVLTTPGQCSFQEQAQYVLMPLLWKKSIWNACHFANIWWVMSSWGLVPRTENSFSGKAKYFRWTLNDLIGERLNSDWTLLCL